jgi:hypothetical protein
LDLIAPQAEKQQRKFRTETLAGRFAGLLLRKGEGEEAGKPVMRHAIYVLLEQGHLLFKENRLWKTSNVPEICAREKRTR